jgi:diguanylate cyclase (GGDEF)-like protein/PAS domain S-box-containing protein
MAMMIGPRGILAANESAQRLFDKTIGAAINGRSVLDVLPDSAAFYAAVLEGGLAGKTLSFREQPIRLASKGRHRTHWFNLDFMPVHGSDGTPLAVLGIASDVSSFVRRIHSLSESEQRLRLALEGSGMVGIWTLDLASGMATADANVARTYGLSPELCEGGVADERFIAAIHPEDRQRVNAALARTINTGTPYRCKYRVIADSDQTRWVITSAKPALDEAGKVAQLLGVVVDVTDQMETAAALAESRFQFQTLTETLPQIVWSCDAEGRHDYFSARWSEFTGIEPEDITEETWKELVFPEHSTMVANVWNNALRTGQPYDIDYRFRHRSGQYRWLRVMALPVRGDDGQIMRWFGTSTDVHEAYLLAEDRERLARELERVATEDALTGLLTRRAFIDKVTAMINRNLRSRHQASLLMLDIDHFKSINDTYGHPAGDRVLASAASRLRAAVRKQDIVGRLGGEEFAVYLPQCSKREALEVAGRIRDLMGSDSITLEGGGAVVATVSIGVTTGPENRLTLDQSLGVADKALYLAKTGGRNRAVFTGFVVDGCL